MEEILFQIPHIKLIILNDGKHCLIVEDTELNDYVEDFLSENHDIESNSVSLEDNSKLSIYYNYFEESDVERLVIALRKLDLIEVENIFNINN
jgi:hypothetical protein